MKPITKERWLEAQALELGENRQMMVSAISYKDQAIDRHGRIMGVDRKTSLDYKDIADIGGGYTSMLPLLKDIGVGSAIIDPIEFTKERIDYYYNLGIEIISMTAEDFVMEPRYFDEVFIYNVLQHTLDPELILRNVARVAPVLRISEPLNYPENIAHPHVLEELWMRSVLDEISVERQYMKIEYDFVYFGGVFRLKPLL